MSEGRRAKGEKRSDQRNRLLFWALENLRSSSSLTFPVNPKFRGRLSVALIIISMWLGDGVHVVALVPVAGPVPPPSIVVKPEAMASSAS